MAHEAIIVGTGFGGMGAAISLKRLGIEDFVMLEREDDLGGTWHVNRYPGLAVDIASVTYSYSFEPNPWWSHWYARGPELKRYAEHVADRYDLRRHMRFGTVVEGAVWDEDAQEWEVRVAGGERLRAAYLDHRDRLPVPAQEAGHRRRRATSPATCCTRRAGTTPPTSTASGSRSSAPARPRCS